MRGQRGCRFEEMENAKGESIEDEEKEGKNEWK